MTAKPTRYTATVPRETVCEPTQLESMVGMFEIERHKLHCVGSAPLALACMCLDFHHPRCQGPFARARNPDTATRLIHTSEAMRRRGRS